MEVIPTGARFLSPSLGNPSFLSMQERTLTAFIVATKGYLIKDDLNDLFYLNPVSHTGSSIALRTAQVTEDNDNSVIPQLQKILRPKREFSFFDVKLKRHAQEKQVGIQNQRFVLYDLCHPRIDTGSHSVVLLYHGWESIRFCFISDMHVAEAWDSIQADFSRLPENQTEIDRENIFVLSRAFSRRVYLENFINPNKNLVSFIKTANDLARKNELDFIIAGGDLVDTKFKKTRHKKTTSYKDTNYRLLEDILTGKYDSDVELKVPLFTVTGNHDYRLYPHSFRNYGLDRCGVHDLLKDHYLAKNHKKAGKMLSLSDLDSIRDKKGKDHSLNYYFVHFNPHTDFSFMINKTRFIFVDSGRDAFLNLARTHVLRYKNFARAILASWYFPDSEGMSDKQIQFIRKEMNTGVPKNVVLVFHAGLLNTSFETDLNQVRTFPIRPNDYFPRQGSLRANVAFESRLKKLGLNFGCLFKNQLKLLALVNDSGLKFLGLSGHNHRNMQIKVDKKKGTLRTGNYILDSLTNPFEEEAAYFLSSNALGHIQPRYKTCQIPGFLEAHFQNDHIVDIRRKKLEAYPLDSYLFFVRLIDRSKSVATIEVLSEVPAVERTNNGENVRLIVTFLIGIKKGIKKGEILPLEIKPRNRKDVIAESAKPLTVEEKNQYAGKRNICQTYSFLCESHSELQFDFHKVDNIRRTYEITVLAEYILDSTEGIQSLRLCWHPVVLDLKL